jgi:hypothetical protein
LIADPKMPGIWLPPQTVAPRMLAAAVWIAATMFW